MFQVICPTPAGPMFLRSTVWTWDAGRAATFATEAEARAALDKARKFMRPAAFKSARIVPGPAAE